VPHINWFHSHVFGNGAVATGKKSLNTLRGEAQFVFKYPVAGLSVLDIGAWDGFFSFEAERRGARDVLATDHFCWSGEGWGTKAGFDHAHAQFGSKVRSLDIDVFDLDPRELGQFDVVLFLGVFYHLRNPIGGLEQVFKMTRELAVIETAVDELDNDNAVMRYYLGRELGGDETSFFLPNVKCLDYILRDIGFRKFECVHSEQRRVVAHVWK
jgi:tRNA (mo5U34)-methyltransferase